MVPAKITPRCQAGKASLLDTIHHGLPARVTGIPRQMYPLSPQLLGLGAEQGPGHMPLIGQTRSPVHDQAATEVSGLLSL